MQGNGRMGKINASWHLKNKMPTKATLEQRIKWHLEHSENCSCRPIPEKLLNEMTKKNILSAKET